MDVKTKLKGNQEARAWALRCQQLEQMSDTLKHMAMNPETTEPEVLAELGLAIKQVSLGEQVTPAWVAGVLLRHPVLPLAWLASRERVILRSRRLR